LIAFPNEAARLASLKASDTVWEKRKRLVNTFKKKTNVTNY